MIFVLCFRDIMVGTRHNPESSGTGDEEIRNIIHDEVVAAIRDAIPEMFRSIKTTLIKTFDEQYAAVTEAVAAAATPVVAATRPRGGDSLLFREFSNTKPPDFDGTQDLRSAMRWIGNTEG